MAIRTKAELIAQYADNVTGDISAADLRDFVNSNLSLEFLTISSTPVSVADTTDIIIGLTGAGLVNLPAISSFKNRALTVTNDGSSTMTIDPDGSETIAGLSILTMAPGRVIFLYSEVGTTDWNIIIDNLGQFINLLDTPTSYVSDPNKFLRVDALGTQVTFQDTEFTFNADTPSSFSGAANQHVTINGGETALVFTDAVDSFISRTGAVVAAASDYDASQVDNDSTVSGVFVDDALNQLDTDITAKPDDFLDLTDTPSSYSGEGGNLVAVNGGETALEFIAPSSSTAAQFFEEANTAATTINDLVAFEDLNISLAANSLNTLGDFSISGNTLTKTTSGTSTYTVMWCFDCEPDTGNNRDYTIKAFKNGSTALDGRATVTITSTQPRSGQIFTLVSLAQNDTIDLKVRADSNTVDFISINNEIMMRLA